MSALRQGTLPPPVRPFYPHVHRDATPLSPEDEVIEGGFVPVDFDSPLWDDELFYEPVIPYDDPAWDVPGIFLDADSIREARWRRAIPPDAVLTPPELVDDLDFDTPAAEGV